MGLVTLNCFVVEPVDANIGQEVVQQPGAQQEAVKEKIIDSKLAQDLLLAVNQERAKVGVQPLVLDEELMEAAMIRVKELPISNSHTRPDGSRCFTVLKFHNAYKGENIASGHSSVADVMEGWMDSPGHKANILNPHFTKLGVGYLYNADATYRHYWTQIFMGEEVKN